jgi:hypothetical protein
MATVKYQSPFKPYPFIDSDEVTHTSTSSDDFVVAVGDCVQQKGTDKVFRLVRFDNAATDTGIDFTAGRLTYNYSGCVAGGDWIVRQDFSDTSGVVAGVCPKTIDVSAMSADTYGWIQVAGSCEVTNHDGTCPIGSELVSHGVDNGTTDVRATLEQTIGVVVDEAGTTTPIVDLFIVAPGVQKVQVDG